MTNSTTRGDGLTSPHLPSLTSTTCAPSPQPMTPLLPAVATAGVLLETSLGALTIDLFGLDCPSSSANFANLCRCRYWNGCTACEIIPDVALFFAHDTHSAYDTELVQAMHDNTALDQSERVSNSFYALVRAAGRVTHEQCRASSPGEWSEEDVTRKERAQQAAASRECVTSKQRTCTGLQVQRLSVSVRNRSTSSACLPSSSATGTRDLSQQSPLSVQPRIGVTTPFRARPPHSPGSSINSPGLLLVEARAPQRSTSSSSHALTAAHVYKFALTLSARSAEYLDERYVVIGQVRDGWDVLRTMRGVATCVAHTPRATGAASSTGIGSHGGGCVDGTRSSNRTTSRDDEMGRRDAVGDGRRTTLVLPSGQKAWPRPVRMLRIKHATVLPTPGTESYADVWLTQAAPSQAAPSPANETMTSTFAAMRQDGVHDAHTAGGGADVWSRSHTGHTMPDTTSTGDADEQSGRSLAAVLQESGCFGYWASMHDIYLANRALQAMIVSHYTRGMTHADERSEAAAAAELPVSQNSPDAVQPCLLLLPPVQASEEASKEEIYSMEYNPHYTADYLSSDDDEESRVLGTTAENQNESGGRCDEMHAAVRRNRTRAAASTAGERASLRQSALALHREKVNETLTLMMNVLNGVADLDGTLAPPENVLFVCKLNPATTSEGLAMCFGQFGEVRAADVIRDRQTNRSLCYGFVEFGDVEACYRALTKMDRALVDDCRIHVDFSQSVSKLWAQRQREMRKRARPRTR